MYCCNAQVTSRGRVSIRVSIRVRESVRIVTQTKPDSAQVFQKLCVIPEN